jgi:hypothetical protein
MKQKVAICFRLLIAALICAGSSIVVVGTAKAKCFIKCVTIKPPHIDPPKINIPAVNLGHGLSLTPGGVVPSGAVNKANDVLNKAVTAAAPAANQILNAGAKTVAAGVAPAKALGNVIAGKDSLGDAARGVAQAEGAKYAAIGTAVSEVNAAKNNIQVIAAESIAGNVGKTVMTLDTGADRLSVDFAAVPLIIGGEVLQGQSPDSMITAPFAAALRSANYQFLPQSKPIPPSIMQLLKGKYPDDVLTKARYAIGSISISVPDVVIQFQKGVYGDAFAVTVGNVTVFSHEPGDDVHWWAHEMQHQVQYEEWGIDQFAFKYVKSCHAVESEAEDKAQKVAPLPAAVKVLC